MNHSLSGDSIVTSEISCDPLHFDPCPPELLDPLLQVPPSCESFRVSMTVIFTCAPPFTHHAKGKSRGRQQVSEGSRESNET
jgi:hypothetical protein